MSGDEVLVTIASLLLGPVAWVVWLFRMSGAQRLRQSAPLNVLAGAVALCAILIFIVLKTAASFDVVNDARYQIMYLLLGLAWLRLAQLTFALAGVSARDDVAERGNQAAAIALAGALVGTALCYAGGNIGDGPGWWVVVFCAALATGTFMLAWLVLTLVTAIADAVAIDRDRAAGLRLGGFLVAVGLVLGRGVAGDWHSGQETIADFLPALPWAAVILVAAIALERILRSTAERPHGPVFSLGLIPAIAYLGLAAMALGTLGWPT
jgi:uncharacterized membrane protein YjfL (UPF0719 family)